jgi:hypothetical protein
VRRPISAMTAAALVFALCPGLIRAQGQAPDVGQPPAREDSATGPAVFDPMASARGARHLLRNGQDYVNYEQYDRALTFLREAEARQVELNVAERQQLKQALERAQRGLRQPGNAKKSRYAKTRTNRAGAIASATTGQAPTSPSGFQLTSGTQATEVPAAAPAPAVAAPAPARLPSIATPEPAPAPAPLPADVPAMPAPAAEPAPLELPAPTPAQSPAPAQPEPAPLALPASTMAPASAQPEPAPLSLPEATPAPAQPEPPPLSLPTAEPASALPAPEPAVSRPAPEPAAAMPVPEPAMPSPSAEPAMILPAPEPEPVASMPSPETPAFTPAAEPIAPPASSEPALPQLPDSVPDAAVASRPDDAPAGRHILSTGVPGSIADLPPAAPAEELGLPPLPAGEAPAPVPAGRPAMASPESAAPRPAMVAQDPEEASRPTVGGLAASEADPVPVPAPEATQLPDAPPESTSVPALTDTPPAPARPGSVSATVPEDRSDVPAHLRHLLPRRDTKPFQSSLSPGSLRAVEEVARRQDDAMRRTDPTVTGPTTPGSTNVTSPRLELSRAPSPAEPRPIRAIPVPEDFVPMAARQWGPRRKYWSAAAVCNMPLYFQDASLERYGHSAEQFFGPTGRHLSYPLDDVTQSKQRNQIIQPFFSAGLFAAQIAFLPYNLLMDPPWEAQYELGYYRPNDKIPTDTYYLPLTGIGPPLHGKNY